MRRLLSLAFAALGLASLCAISLPTTGLAATAVPAANLPTTGRPPRPTARFNAAQVGDLDRISAYLNSIRSLKSNFVQLGPDGQLDQGTFYLSKPGQLRFAYQPPSPILIVATGGEIYVRNAKLNTVDRYSVSDLPLDILLDGTVDLKYDRSVLGVEEQPDALILHARTSVSHTQGNITLVFSFPQIELRQWMVKDNQGGVTTVALTGLQTGITLPGDLFTVPAKDASPASP